MTTKRKAVKSKEKLSFKMVKGGPRTQATFDLWEARKREFLIRDHPSDCAICLGANDPEGIVARHETHWAQLAEAYQEREAANKQAQADYYAGGFRMIAGGAPIRTALWVSKWELSNRQALGKGYDHQGLVVPTQNTPSPKSYQITHIASKEIGPHEGPLSDLARKGGYDLADWLDKPIMWRREQWVPGGGLSSSHAQHYGLDRKQVKPQGNQRTRLAPDLFTAGRIQRKREASRAK